METLYNHYGETFRLVSSNQKVKLYHKAKSRWSSGWTYIGTFKNEEKAKASARLYAN